MIVNLHIGLGYHFASGFGRFLADRVALQVSSRSHVLVLAGSRVHVLVPILSHSFPGDLEHGLSNLVVREGLHDFSV